MLTRFLLLAGFALLIVVGSQTMRRGGERDLGAAHSYRPTNFGCAGARAAARQHPAEARAMLEAANDA